MMQPPGFQKYLDTIDNLESLGDKFPEELLQMGWLAACQEAEIFKESRRQVIQSIAEEVDQSIIQDLSKIRLYLAGPMSGLPEGNHPEFRKWADKLRSVGYVVLSPHEFGQEGSWLNRISEDLKALDKFEPHGIALLPGWSESPGARIEHIVAKRLGWEIHSVEEWFNAA